MEQLVILIVIGLLSLINWIIQKSKEYKAKQAATESRNNARAFGKAQQQEQNFPEENAAPAARTWEASDQALQDFYDNIGVENPVSAPPPPQEESQYFESYQEPAPQEEFYQQEVQQPVYEEPLPEPVPPPIPGFATQEASVIQPDEAELALARRLEAAETPTQVIQKMPPVSGSVRAFLKTPEALRKAVLLKEILGKPKALSGI
ncbi:MAG: hypothetical protein ACK5NG_06225 [Chthoniobacterales bacterium]